MLLGAAAGVGWWLVSRADAGQDQPEAKSGAGARAAVPVNVAKVERRDVPRLARTIGTVQSLHQVTLRPQVDGVLTEVLFDEGATVQRGQLLARIDHRSIASELESALADKARNEAQLAAAERDLVRYRNLAAEHAISQQAIDQQVAAVAQLKAAGRASDAAIASARTRLSFTRITSPVNGRVGLRRVDPGNLVRAADANGLVTVTQIDPISVVFALTQDYLAQLRPLLADPEAAPVVAYDRDAGAELARGKLTMLDNQVDAATGTIKLRAEFPNAGGALWPGQFVTIELRIGQSRDALTVPSVAVQRGLEQPFVFRVRAGKAEVVPVVVELDNGAVAVVDRVPPEGRDSPAAHGGKDAPAELTPGDLVVIDGQSRLKAGTPVAIGPRDRIASAARGGDDAP